MSDCVFCDIAARQAAQMVETTELTLAFLDARPVFKGHVLVVPRAHHMTLADLPDGQLGPFFAAVRRISAAIPLALGSQGTFVAINNVVSQSVPHLHAHIVPRTRGDGLRGFFWPRTRYASAAEADEYAGRIRGSVESGEGRMGE